MCNNLSPRAKAQMLRLISMGSRNSIDSETPHPNLKRC
jgi:hypothetical protein